MPWIGIGLDWIGSGGVSPLVGFSAKEVAAGRLTVTRLWLQTSSQVVALGFISSTAKKKLNCNCEFNVNWLQKYTFKDVMEFLELNLVFKAEHKH